jgi:outer membrane protein
MRVSSVVFACLFTVLAGSVSAQERYPALGQDDVTPGTPSLPQDLELTVAAGVGYEPEYMGSDDYEAIFTPAIHLDYKQRAFFVVDRQAMMVPYEGLGVKMLANQDFSVGFNLTYDDGREDEGDIAGMGDLDWTVLGGMFAAWHPGPFFVRGQIGYDLMDEFDSYKGEIGAGYVTPINPQLRGMIDVSAAFGGEDFNQAFFGVTGAQSGATGLPAFGTEAGFYRVGVGGTLQYTLTQGAFVQGIARLDTLVGDASDSPISDDDTMLFLGANAGYHF